MGLPRREGTRRYYQADPTGLIELRRYLESMWDDILASRALYSTVAPDGAGPLDSLELIHSHWERLGDKARAARRGSTIGWAYVLTLYADRHGPLVISLDLIGRLAMTIGRLRRAG